MPTDKPRITITMSQETYEEIEAYRFSTRQKNQTQAILSLISSGLDSLSEDPQRNIPSYSKDELELINLHRKLNREGQEKLIGYAEDLVASGRYKKLDFHCVVEEA